MKVNKKVLIEAAVKERAEADQAAAEAEQAEQEAIDAEAEAAAAVEEAAAAAVEEAANAQAVAAAAAAALEEGDPEDSVSLLSSVSLHCAEKDVRLQREVVTEVKLSDVSGWLISQVKAGLVKVIEG